MLLARVKKILMLQGILNDNVIEIQEEMSEFAKNVEERIVLIKEQVLVLKMEQARKIAEIGEIKDELKVRVKGSLASIGKSYSWAHALPSWPKLTICR